MRRIEAPEPFLRTLNRLFKKNPKIRATFQNTLKELAEDPFTQASPFI